MDPMDVSDSTPNPTTSPRCRSRLCTSTGKIVVAQSHCGCDSSMDIRALEVENQILIDRLNAKDREIMALEEQNKAAIDVIHSMRELVLRPITIGKSSRPVNSTSLCSYIDYQHVTAKSDPPYSHFVHLPGELRNIIYECALVSAHPIDIWPITQETDDKRGGHDAMLKENLKGINVNLLQVSRQIYLEATGIFYGHNAFRFSDEYASIAMVIFFESIGSNCRYITNVSAHVSFNDRSAYALYDLGTEHDIRMEAEFIVLCRRFGRPSFNSLLGPSFDEIHSSEVRAEAIVRRLPALRFFSLVVPHYVVLRVSAMTGQLLTDMGFPEEDAEMVETELTTYQAYLQENMFKAAEAMGAKVKSTLIFLRRHPSFPATSDGLNLDDDGEMGRNGSKKEYKTLGWDIKYGSYGCPEIGISYVVDKEACVASAKEEQ
ncbi:hypothetical protein AOQ84DRAFT_223911 [Glonium stellatum]|uniref:Uncharacterized protein n=1 Tax=Glonium stellatum TaxID=574774 RepID=A0A8E2FB37_9PEZI|nr:hypothetical protein AOQ84DRAFT_223911 [Glonium stellatum]